MSRKDNMMLKFPNFFLTFVVLALLAGCGLNNQPTTSPNLPITQTANIPTDRPTVVFTRTVAPTFTTTPIPTLLADEAYKRVHEILKTNPNCQLPCWWGITPGKSIMADVQKQLTIFSGIANDEYIGTAGKSWFLESLDLNYPNEDKVISINSSYLASSAEDKVVVIGVDTQAMPKNLIGQVYGDSKYNELLSAYTLSHILATFGKPDQIVITAEIYHNYEQGAPDFFEIRLLYPDKGIFVKYTMPAEMTADTYKFCPSNAFIKLTLIQPDLSDGYQELLLKLGDEWYGFFPLSSIRKTPDEAIGMNIEDFYRVFSTPTTSCLASPQSIWQGR